MVRQPRSVELLVDEQVRRWQLRRQGEPSEHPGPVVTVSREHGARGEDVARQLADELGFAFFDNEIIREICESAHLSERVVRSADETNREVLTDWLTAFAGEPYLSQVGYLQHLMHVIGAIERHGNAVILGRGGHLILGPGRALRVLVMAPMAARVAETARRDGVSEREARRRVEAVDAQRRAFLVKNFHVDSRDLGVFDIVVNTAVLGVEGAVGIVRAAVTALPRMRPVTVVGF